LKSFPSDGLIIGDRSKSPLGAQGERNLNGATIDYCYTGGESQFLNPEHRERVERAWSLLIAQRNGRLSTFSGDEKSCFDRFGEEKAPEGREFSIDPTDSNYLYMYNPEDVPPRTMNARPVKARDSGAPRSPTDINAEAARFDRPARDTPPSTKAGPAWIGIRWLDQIDLDLYVKCEATSPFLFFGNSHSREGHHNGDYRSGTGKEFESVDLTTPCADIRKAQVYVNFYSGSVSTSPKGVFAIEFDGGLYKADFEIPAHVGNRGAGGNEAGTMGAPYWVKIDLAAVLHMNASATAHPRPRATR
jgi:hypothetical protein